MPYLRLICSLLLLPLLLSISLGQGPNVNDPKDLEAFFDGVLYQQLAGKHVAGAVVTVVSGDKVIFSKGYGYSDVANRKPVEEKLRDHRLGLRVCADYPPPP